MLSPTRSGFRLPSPTSSLPKVLVIILVIAVFSQLLPRSSESRELADVAASSGDSWRETWFQGTTKTHKEEEEDTTASTPVNYNQTFVSYGATQCLPAFDDSMKKLASERNQSCTKYAPFAVEETRRVAFATITTGKPEEAYQRAIQSQMFHSAVHGMSTHVLCEQLSDGAWNKIAFLLNLVMNEMLKPEDERLEWVMWIDRDAIVLDSCRPLSAFVPPATEEFENVNLITNNDMAGLNAGVFMFRVSEWTISLFNTILAFRYYRPDEELELAEQTAMEIIMHEKKWSDSVVRVPWHWFNTYPDGDKSGDKFRNGAKHPDDDWFRGRKGDFVLHFAGDPGRAARMPAWMDMLNEVGNVWEEGDVQRDISNEIEEYWSSWKSGTLTTSQISGQPQKKERIEQRDVEEQASPVL